ncbi:MAG TPA: AbgT family transporter [Vicinamibacteria bacterium]|nr:AbgT family transporter [Vicinamibacteria bacterium]
MSRLSRGFTAFLDCVERAGNLLPHPASLFAIFALLVILVSGSLAKYDRKLAAP